MNLLVRQCQCLDRRREREPALEQELIEKIAGCTAIADVLNMELELLRERLGILRLVCLPGPEARLCQLENAKSAILLLAVSG